MALVSVLFNSETHALFVEVDGAPVLNATAVHFSKAKGGEATITTDATHLVGAGSLGATAQAVASQYKGFLQQTHDAKLRADVRNYFDKLEEAD
jgi:hypothetical protein